MPQTCGVVLEALQAVRLNLSHLLIRLHGLIILGLLEQASGYLSLNPACLSLFSSQVCLVLRLCLFTVVLALEQVCFT